MPEQAHAAILVDSQAVTITAVRSRKFDVRSRELRYDRWVENLPPINPATIHKGDHETRQIAGAGKQRAGGPGSGVIGGGPNNNRLAIFASVVPLSEWMAHRGRRAEGRGVHTQWLEQLLAHLIGEKIPCYFLKR